MKEIPWRMSLDSRWLNFLYRDFFSSAINAEWRVWVGHRYAWRRLEYVGVEYCVDGWCCHYPEQKPLRWGQKALVGLSGLVVWMWCGVWTVWRYNHGQVWRRYGWIHDVVWVIAGLDETDAMDTIDGDEMLVEILLELRLSRVWWWLWSFVTCYIWVCVMG